MKYEGETDSESPIDCGKQVCSLSTNGGFDYVLYADFARKWFCFVLFFLLSQVTQANKIALIASHGNF